MSIYLNMDPGAPPVVVKASEGDIGRTFEFMLIQNGSEYEIPAGTTIKAEIRKPDGHGTEILCTWSGSVVTLETTEQSTIRAGKGFGELRLSKDSTNIGTANFILAVEPRPINTDTDQTDSSYSQTGEAGDVWTLGSNGVPSWAKGGLDATTATAGQVLTADGAGGHYWGDIEAKDGYSPTIALTELEEGVRITATNKDGQSTAIVKNGVATQSMIDDWLDRHPEATTTVQDGAVTMDKLSADVKSQLGTRANHNYLYNSEQAEGTSTFIELFQKVKNEVMDEYRGNIDKIPIILCTDQHGALTGSKAVFDAINSCVNWYDISKFFNLGDTVSSNYGTYSASTDEFTTNGTLENGITALSSIPMDKQVNVFGNHDTWCTKSGETGYKMLPQNLLSPYFRNAQGHRKANAGYFSIKDDYFNVKYVVVSGLEYIGGIGVNVGRESASTEQIDWLIDELGKDDGYDIVMVCHEPLFPDWAGRSFESQMIKMTSSVNNSNRWAWLNTDEIFLARKRKSSGTFTDRSGVVHTFDYSDAKTELLCGIDGHLHYDCSQYTGNDEFLCESFGCFKHNDGDFIYFILIDRENSRLNIWKIDTVNLAYENYRVPFAIDASMETYVITRRLKNVSTWQISNTVRQGQTFFDKLTANSGYTIGTVKVTMGGTDITSSAYDSSTGKIYIASVTGDIDVTAYDSTASATDVVHVINWNVENINITSGATLVYSDETYPKPINRADGNSYTAAFKATDSGYAVNEISATMGNSDLAGSITSSRGTITLNIASVTNDVNISAKAYPITYEQGALVNGVVDSSATSYGTTSFVPVDGSRVGKFILDPTTQGAEVRIAFYDTDKEFISQISLSNSRTSTTYVSANTRYIRVTMYYDTRYPNFVIVPPYDIEADASVTVNVDSDLTVGAYPATIRKGSLLQIPISVSEGKDGEVIIDSVTAGGSATSYTYADGVLTIGYVNGDVVVTAHFKATILFELTEDTTYESAFDTGIKPASSLNDSFTYMVDFDYPTGDNNTAIISTYSSNNGVDFSKYITTTGRIRYSGNPLSITNFAVGTRAKLVMSHMGGASSYDLNVVCMRNSEAELQTDTVSAPTSASTANRRIDGKNLTLNAGVTYHKVKIMSRVATQNEINAFLHDWS